MARYEASDGWQGAEFVQLDMSGATFRNVDLRMARMHGVVLTGVEIGGSIRGLKVNGVEVEPLIEAELDRQHPERARLRPRTVDGMREAWRLVEAFWDGTMRKAGALSDANRHRSVNGEWSFAQTLRHLIFITDAWLSHALLGRQRPFHPLGLPPTFITDAETYGIDPAATAPYRQVVEVRAERMAQVRTFLQEVTQEELDRTREPNLAPGWPPPAPRGTIRCLHALLREEWAHHQYAIRDLAALHR